VSRLAAGRPAAGRPAPGRPAPGRLAAGRLGAGGTDPTGRIVFVGAVHEAVPALAALIDGPARVVGVITMPRERAAQTSGYVDLGPLARATGADLLSCADINHADSVGEIRGLAPDLIVVVGWTRLLGAELLGVPPGGCVGFHASLLPRYRGRAPVNWAILRGETLTGNTMMFLDAGTDTGDVIDQRSVPITAEDTCATVYARVADVGAAMLRQHMPALLDGTAPRAPQGPASDAPLPKRTPQMGVTEWRRPARGVHDWIRALTEPYPGAHTFWAGRKLMLWASAVPEPLAPGCPAGQPAPGAGPGEIIGCDARGMWVATGSGNLLVTAMSDAGSLPEPPLAWARRCGLRAGDRFDPVDDATARWALGLGPAPAGTPAGTR
jgi:methionyl-tRNA formyltransferase